MVSPYLVARERKEPTSRPGKWVEHRLVPVADIRYDYLYWDESGAPHGYQRPADEPRIEEIVRKFSMNLLTEGVVSERSDGSVWGVDCQHRAKVAQRVGLTHIRCAVHHGLTVAEEASLYHELNTNHVNPNGWNRFGARAAGGDPVALAVINLLAEFGLRTGTADRSLKSIAAVSTLEKLYQLPVGPRLLKQTLHKLLEFWPGDITARDGVFVEGLARFIYTWDGSYYEPRDRAGQPVLRNVIDWSRAKTLFAGMPAIDVMRAVKRLKAESGLVVNAGAYAVAFRDIYNGRSTFGRRLDGKPVTFVVSATTPTRQFQTSRRRRPQVSEPK